MNVQSTELNLVHESEAQRRHARVKIPAYLQLPRGTHSGGKFALIDLSASGFSIYDKKYLPDENTIYRGKLQFTFNDVDMLVNVSFRVVYHNHEDNRKGCEFQDLTGHEISLLRVMLTKYLSGEIIQVGDVLTTLSRDNFTKGRNTANRGQLRGLAKLRAKIITFVVFVIGCIAFSYVITALYDLFFINRAVSAAVSIPYTSAIAPREGYIKMLVKPGDKVSAGQPLVTLDSPLLETIAPMIDESMGLTTEELQRMVSSNVSGVIESRCNCVVVRQLVKDGEYLLKGESVFQLAPVDASPYVLARFQNRDIDQLTPGTRVSVEFGDRSAINGTISQIRPPQDVATAGKGLDDVLVSITLDEKIDLSLVDRPVIVKTKALFTFNQLDNRLNRQSLDGFVDWVDKVKP